MPLPTKNQYGTFTKDVALKWNEFLQCYKKDRARKKLIEDAKPGFELLKAAGIETIYIVGSFASNKRKPNDIDGLFFTDGKYYKKEMLSEDSLDILESFGLDFYPADMPTQLTGESHLEFFRRGRNNESPGFIILSLKDL